MRVMTKKQEKFLEELTRLAQGDVLVVEEALRTFSRKDKASFAQLAKYITDKTKAAA